MTKFKSIIFALCLTIGASLCFANHADFKKADGVPITISKSTNFSGVDKSSTISASIDGHNLTINFLSNIGHVEIKITDATGVTLEIDHSETPAGYLYYIPSVGHYVVVITFSDGDEYYGEFDVTL